MSRKQILMLSLVMAVLEPKYRFWLVSNDHFKYPGLFKYDVWYTLYKYMYIYYMSLIVVSNTDAHVALRT